MVCDLYIFDASPSLFVICVFFCEVFFLKKYWSGLRVSFPFLYLLVLMRVFIFFKTNVGLDCDVAIYYVGRTLVNRGGALSRGGGWGGER
jgi:hypothetical protein